MRTFLIILLGTLSLLLPRSGWSHDLYFRHYTNKQGLSHNTVYCALQDKKGFMWFGTDDGLNRFDGHQFRIYRYNSYEPESLPNDRIISLFEDMGLHLFPHLLLRLSNRCFPSPDLFRQQQRPRIFPTNQRR